MSNNDFYALIDLVQPPVRINATGLILFQECWFAFKCKVQQLEILPLDEILALPENLCELPIEQHKAFSNKLRRLESSF